MSEAFRLTPAQLRMARAALKMGIRELASAAGVAAAAIASFEHERTNISAAIQQKLADELGAAGIVFINDDRREGVVMRRDRK